MCDNCVQFNRLVVAQALYPVARFLGTGVGFGDDRDTSATVNFFGRLGHTSLTTNS